MNKILTTFILGNEDLFIKDIRDEVEIIRFNKLDDIFNARGSYISFVDSEDNISDDYFSRILDKIKFNEFDSCFINYRINYDYVRELKVRTDEYDLNSKVPKKNSYIWNFVFIDIYNEKESFICNRCRDTTSRNYATIYRSKCHA